MAFARKFRHFFALFFVLVWTHMDLYGAYRISRYAFASDIPQEDSQTVSDSSRSDLPGEGAEKLFDLNTDTVYAPDAPVLVQVNLGQVQKITEIRIFGHASFLLSIQENVNGQWHNVGSLTDVDMDAGELSAEGWHSCKFPDLFETDSLRIQLVPAPGNSREIKEMAIWSDAVYLPVPAENISVLKDGGVSTAQGRLYRTENESGIIGPEQEAYADADADNSFHFSVIY